jgi:hypothetical protein
MLDSTVDIRAKKPMQGITLQLEPSSNFDAMPAPISQTQVKQVVSTLMPATTFQKKAQPVKNLAQSGNISLQPLNRLAMMPHQDIS